jgi:hypothetical protein
MNPLIFEGFNSIYSDAQELCEKNKKKNETLKYFQIFLKQIPGWNATVLDRETERIKKECPFIMKIVTAIFTSYVKILSSIRIRGKNSNIKIKIPMCDLFIHSVYINSAKVVFYEPKLFKDNVDQQTRSDNAKRVNCIIERAIDETISSLIPIENILQEYIGNIYDDEKVENDIDSKESDSNSETTEDSETESEKIISFGNRLSSQQDPFNNSKEIRLTGEGDIDSETTGDVDNEEDVDSTGDVDNEEDVDSTGDVDNEEDVTGDVDSVDKETLAETTQQNPPVLHVPQYPPVTHVPQYPQVPQYLPTPPAQQYTPTPPAQQYPPAPPAQQYPPAPPAQQYPPAQPYITGHKARQQYPRFF